MSSLSEESSQGNPKHDKVALSPGSIALSKVPQEAKGVVEKLESTEYYSTGWGVSHGSAVLPLSSNKTSLSHRYRYSKAELETWSARAKLPIDCIESSLEILGNLRRLEKSPFVKPKNSPSFESSPTFSDNWLRGSFLNTGENREPSTSFRNFPKRDDSSRKKQHKQTELRSHETRPRFNRTHKPQLGSKKLLLEVWYYRDPQNEIQGPFSLLQLREWLEAGYYDGTLPVSEDGSDTFQPLELVLKAFTTHDAPSGIGKKREDTIGKDRVISLDETKPQMVSFNAVPNELQQSIAENDTTAIKSASMLQNELRSENQTVLYALSSSQSKDGLYSREISSFRKSSNETDDTDLYSNVERTEQKESHELEGQSCQLIFGNDISPSVESESKNSQEIFPLERDIAELERDLVSNLDLDSGAYSSDGNFASFPDSSLTVGQWQYDRHSNREQGELDENQKRRMNPAEYLMSIDPAIAKASISSKSTSPDKNLQRSNVVASNTLTLEQDELLNAQNLNENGVDLFQQYFVESNAFLSDSAQGSYQPVAERKSTGVATKVREEQRNNFQEAKKMNEKKKRSHAKRNSSNPVESSLQLTPVDNKSTSDSRIPSGREGNVQSKPQAEAVSHSQGANLSDSCPSNTNVFDNFFKAFSDSSKTAWNTWSVSASNLRYPLSLREVQLEEERRQKEEALKVNEHGKMEGLQAKKLSPWDRRPIESAPFAEIQRREMEQQALRMKQKSNFQENRTKGRSELGWSDILTGSSSTWVSHQQSSMSSVEKGKDTEVVNCPKGVGFWDMVDHSLEPNESKVKSLTPNSSTKGSVDEYESLNSVRNGSFGANIPEDLKKWCEEQFSELIGSRDVTLAEFLASLKTREEIREYAIIYLGSSRRTEDFVEEFVRRLQFEFESERVTSGFSSSKTFKSGRRRKKS
ncbi:hypothetical protein GpartN1_g3965.t1 [Galdieria partita]|uniref:GYF domain-containing protein n=1 Tax=Galdieria partita TaxID=83374 RepID=A0A9C7UQP6_9RHOD|nr:hypothetical protein GpartN1_g3965.t1 [Galdieria partita]